jgi:hypothetical protein
MRRFPATFDSRFDVEERRAASWYDLDRGELTVVEGAALEAINPQRLGFLSGEIAVPDDFNTIGQTEIGGPFSENPG